MGVKLKYVELPIIVTRSQALAMERGLKRVLSNDEIKKRLTTTERRALGTLFNRIVERRISQQVEPQHITIGKVETWSNGEVKRAEVFDASQKRPRLIGHIQQLHNISKVSQGFRYVTADKEHASPAMQCGYADFVRFLKKEGPTFVLIGIPM